MRKLLFIACLGLFSCTINETCKKKTFDEYIWINDNSGSWDNLRFGKDDTLTIDMPGLGFYNIKWARYQFDEGCNGFKLDLASPDTSYHYSITKNTGSNIWFQQDGGGIYKFHH